MELENQIAQKRELQKSNINQMMGIQHSQPQPIVEVDMDDVRKAITQIQLGREENLDIIKGKVLPVGTIRKRGDQNWIKISETGPSAKQWKYHSKAGSEKGQTAKIEAMSEPEKMESRALASKLFTLVNKVGGAKTFGEQMKLIEDAGITDPEKVVELTNQNLSDVLKYMDGKGMEKKRQDFNIKDELAKLEMMDAIKTGFDKIDVKDRWESYRVFLDLVANGTAKSMIAYGTGGIGKTYNATKIFAKNNLAEYDGDVHEAGDSNYDYVKITGKTSPTALYAALYEHNGKCLMFDDCDSVLEHDDSINILKGALDSGGDNSIAYASGKKLKTEKGETVPQRFKFTGRVAFITNLTAEKMPQPLRSRAFTADLTMTPDETVTMMEEIIHKIEFQNAQGAAIHVSTEDRQSAIDFISDNVNNINVRDLNSRTLGQIAIIKKKLSSHPTLDWKTAAIAMLT